MPTKPRISKFTAIFPQEIKQLALDLRYAGAEGLPEDARYEVAAATKDIWDCQRQISRNILEIGRRVYRVRAILKQDEFFLSWIETAFPRAKSQAYAYLDVFERFKDHEKEYFELAEEFPETTIALLAGGDRHLLKAAAEDPAVLKEVPLPTTVARLSLAEGQRITTKDARQIAQQTRQQIQERQWELNRDVLLAAGLSPGIANKLKATLVPTRKWEIDVFLSLSPEDQDWCADLILSGEAKNARIAKKVILKAQQQEKEPLDVDFQELNPQQAVHERINANWLDWWKEQPEDSADLIWCNAPMAAEKVQDFHLYATEALRTLREGGCLLVILPDDVLDEAISILKSHGAKWGRPIALHLGMGSSQSVGKYCVDDVRLLGPFWKGSRKHTSANADGRPMPAFYNRSFNSFEAAADNLVRRLTNPWDTAWCLGADTTIWERLCLEDRHAFGVGLKA